jgi:hypothetical protein
MQFRDLLLALKRFDCTPISRPSYFGLKLTRLSTGVYWIAPHEVLEGQGLQVLLVDTRQRARVAVALRMAALSLRHSQTALGAYYRKLAQRLGGDVAVFATARKLATLIYRLLRWGQP